MLTTLVCAGIKGVAFLQPYYSIVFQKLSFNYFSEFQKLTLQKKKVEEDKR